MSEAMKQNRLVPWFGSDLAVAAEVGRLLGRLTWCGVPFCGGCSALPYIDTSAGVASDLHRHVINLARCIRDRDSAQALSAYLSRTIFHEDEMSDAQQRCREREADSPLFSAPARDGAPDVQWAADYYVCCWMGRGGYAGRGPEFTHGMAVRYTSSGGDSAKRWTSAVESLDAWRSALRPWSFQCCDAFEILGDIKDEPNHGIYVDPPWPDLGDEYANGFTTGMHKRLCAELGAFKKVRIVIRYGDHPLIRELYPATRWKWHMKTTANQKNNDVAEALITRN